MYSLKKHRLNKKFMFTQIFGSGSKVFMKNLVLHFINSPDSEYRVAFIIKKKIGCAVVRNRIRRIIRETVFKQSTLFQKKCWFIFNIKEHHTNMNAEELRTSILCALEKSDVYNS